jgi:polyether ionophore transport system ATP-binding protein
MELEVAQPHVPYMLHEMAVAAIRTAGLTKDYGAGRGLFDLDLHVAQQEVFGWLGPNGAGKTTTIRLLMGMIHPTAGAAYVFGLDCFRDAVEVKRRVGYLPGDVPQFGSLRGSEIVAYLGGMRGNTDRKVVRALAQRFDLDLSRRFREYSSGNKQKLAIVLAFMHRPDLLILDEPTSGLDPLMEVVFREAVLEAKARGQAVFLSSHILSEVEALCDRVGILRLGRLVDEGTLEQLRHLTAQTVEVTFAGEPPELRLPDGIKVQRAGASSLRFEVSGSVQPLLDALAGRQVVTLTSREPSLEEIFLHHYVTAADARG